MSKLTQFVCRACVIAPLSCAAAVEEPQEHKPFVSVETFSTSSTIQDAHADLHHSNTSMEMTVRPFTGKIRGSKVRLRQTPDLEGHIVKELGKNELVTIVGEKGDFYAIEPPSDIKAYIFRSFVLGNVVEVNRVNIRLKPDLESGVLGHLNAGDTVNGSTCSENTKWLEIDVPSTIHFYVAKEFIENIGGPEVASKIKERKTSCVQALDNAAFLAKTELKKPFTDIDIERIQHLYKKVMNDYNDFPEYVEEAHTNLVALQDLYTQKRIAFLEAKAGFADDGNADSTLVKEELVSLDMNESTTESNPTDKMLLWGPIEEGLYLSWAAQHENRTVEEYYKEQQNFTASISGILETYAAPVKNKPGDFIVKEGDIPVAYVYSTKVNLDSLVGRKVTLLGVERPNNNFAFPAYFIVAAE